MHVLLVSETYPPEVNGVALTVLTLHQELLAAGHRVSLVRPARQGEAVGMRADADLLCTRSLPLPRYPGLRLGLPAGRRLRRFLDRQRPQAVYIATEGPLGWSALRAARRLGVPVVTGFHTRFDDYLGHYGLRFLGRWVAAGLRRFHNRADLTLVPTPELQADLQQRGFARVGLLRRAVDATQFAPSWRDPALRAEWGAGPASPVVLAVGRLAAEKNLQLAERAFAGMQAERPDAVMVWVGDGPERDALRARQPGHRHLGVLRGEALARAYASADLFLFPSLTETFGNVTLEAMASGLAVCAFDYGAARLHIADGSSGHLARFGDEAHFLQQAQRALQDWQRGMPIGTAARSTVDALSPARVAADLVALLLQIQDTPPFATASRSPDHAPVHPPHHQCH